MPQIVTIEHESGAPRGNKALLEGSRDRRLAGGRQAGEPDRGAGMSKRLPTLTACERSALPANVGAMFLAVPWRSLRGEVGRCDLGVAGHSGVGGSVVGHGHPSHVIPPLGAAIV